MNGTCTTFCRPPDSQGRTGQIRVARKDNELVQVETPLLFPVVSLITGGTANGGGVWGYLADTLLNGNDRSYLPNSGQSERNIAILCEALHFFDHCVSPALLHERWLNKDGIRNVYADQSRSNSRVTYGRGPVQHTAPMFVDSGGFRLLRESHLRLQEYGLCADGDEARSIFELQKLYGADMIATLDFPLSPNLDAREALHLINKTTRNAFAAIDMAFASANSDQTYKPLLYLTAHGETYEQIRDHAGSMFVYALTRPVAIERLGLAIGSLVPLRKLGKLIQIVDLVSGGIAAAPRNNAGWSAVPVHTFGISGDMMPLLMYLGVDSFDSTTYLKRAIARHWYNPRLHRYQHLSVIQEQAEYLHNICECHHCSEMAPLTHLTALMEASLSYHPHSLLRGSYKSLVYAQLALHNLHWERKILRDATLATRQNALHECVADMAARKQDLLVASQHAAHLNRDHRLASALERSAPRKWLFVQMPLLPTVQTVKPATSLQFTESSFNVTNDKQNHDDKLRKIIRTWAPPDGARICLLLTCSATKPYASSPSHRAVINWLKRELGDCALQEIHKVTLSGLYGPVPQEFEHEDAVLRYDFLLSRANTRQIGENALRIATYFKKWTEAGRYKQGIFAYVTNPAYRSVIEQAQKLGANISLVPANGRPLRAAGSNHLATLSQSISLALSAGQDATDSGSHAFVDELNIKSLARISTSYSQMMAPSIVSSNTSTGPCSPNT